MVMHWLWTTRPIPMEVSGKEPWSWADHMLLGHTWNLEHRHAGLRSRTTQRTSSLALPGHTPGSHSPPVDSSSHLSAPWKSPITVTLLSSFKQLMFAKPLFIYKVISSTAYSKVLVCVFGHGWVREVFLSLDEWSTGTSPGYKYRIATLEPF